jgi:hypothetical protein
MVLLHFTIIGIAHGQFSVKILNENFDSNAFRWEIIQDEYSEMSISDGKYTLNNKSEGMAITSTIESPHLQDENYRISAKLSKMKGIDNNGFGLVWGSVDANNQFEYVISANGHFKILKWENGEKTDLIEWTYHSGIKKWDMSNNSLAVENSGGLFRFYINDIYVAMLPAQKSSGKKLGFVLNENMLVEVDEIIVENLMPSIDQPVQTNDKLVISSFRLSGNNPGNTVYNNQPETFEIILKNQAETPAKDLSLILLPSKSADVFIYNQLTMIDIIEPGMEKKISIDLQVIENDSIENIEFIAKLQNMQGILLDTGSISIAIKSNPVAYNPYSQQTDENTGYYNPYSESQGDDDIESCTTGCISSGLISIITALILALIPDI